jgi:hypothetical protein
MPRHEPRNPINAPSPPELPPAVKVVLNGFVVTLQCPKLAHFAFVPFALTVEFHIPIKIATGLQMHQTLWLRGPNMEYASRILQNLHNMRVLRARPSNPRHEPRIMIQIFHTNMFFHADRHAV